MAKKDTDLNERELAAVLAGLRLIQRGFHLKSDPVKDVLTDGGRLIPLSDDEIDNLCERLNQ